MEKASKILTILFLVICAYFAWAAFTHSNRINAEQSERESRQVMVIDGPSMEPTLHVGDIVHYSIKSPEIGEIVIFQCHAQRCVTDEEPGGTIFIKRLSKIENGCLTFLGDNTDRSFDSRTYGALCGNDFEIIGVVNSVDYAK